MVKKILITDHYPLNKGIVAVLIAIINSLKRFVPNAEFTVLSYSPEVTPRFNKVKILPPLIKLEPSEGLPKLINMLRLFYIIIVSTTWAILQKVSCAFANFIIKGLNIEKKEILQEYAKSSLILSAGGILDPACGMSGLGILTQFYSAFIAKLLGKPFMIYAYSVLPFKHLSWKRFFFKLVSLVSWNKADLITLRDDLSRRALQDLGVTKPATYVTADPALLLDSEKQERVNEILFQEGVVSTEGRPLIGMTPVDLERGTHQSGVQWAHYHYPFSLNPYAEHKKYEKALAQIADYLIEKLNAIIIFVPMNFKGHPSDDRPIACRIIEKMKHKESVKIIVNEYTAEEQKGIFGQMDLLIGTRMHSLILATPMLVPVIGIAYENKVEAFMERTGQKKWVCDLYGINAEDLINKINELWHTRDEIRRNLKPKIKALQECALLNAKLAAELLKSH